MKSAKTLFVAAVMGASALGALAATPSTAWADKTFTCRFTGTWVGTNEKWLFDAKYIAKDGVDTFTGIYELPGTSRADVSGNAAKGNWKILLTYTDSKHKGMQKVLTGQGMRNPGTNLVRIDGTFKTLVSGTDSKADGKFSLLGQCK